MNTPDKFTVSGGTPSDEDNGGSCERAQTAVSHEGSCNCRECYGRGRGGDVLKTGAPMAPRGGVNSGEYTSTNPNGDSNYDDSYAGGEYSARG